MPKDENIKGNKAWRIMFPVKNEIILIYEREHDWLRILDVKICLMAEDFKKVIFFVYKCIFLLCL